jgi:hypothetical protein
MPNGNHEDELGFLGKIYLKQSWNRWLSNGGKSKNILGI